MNRADKNVYSAYEITARRSAQRVIEMNGFVTMLKLKMKLLLRNPGYLAFLVILPICAVLLLNLNTQTISPSEGQKGKVIWLETENTKIQDTSGINLNVYVYDYAETEISSVFLETLQSTGGVQLYCMKAKEQKNNPIQAQDAVEKINTNTINAVMIIKPEFDDALNRKEYESCISLYYGHEDSRVENLVENMNQFMDTYHVLSQISDEEEAISQLKARNNEMPVIVIEELGMNNGNTIGSQQSWQLYNVKFSWGVITMAFLFSGVFVSNVIIMERNNGVLKRTKLSGSGLTGYGLVMFLLILFTVTIQIIIMGIGIQLFVNVDFGISIWHYLILTFGLAIVLNAFSVMIGIFTNNLLNTSYAVFFAATISSLLSGLYFPKELSGWIGKASTLMPQKWGVRAAEKLVSGADHVFVMFALAIAGFLFVILCVGLLGLNLLQKEDQ